jgi:vancomycin resistance protein YoaR
MAKADTLPDGIYVGDCNLGGMTEDEATQKVQELVSGMENQKVTLVVGDETIETTAKDLGFHWSNPEAVSQAAESWQGGNLIRQYLNKKDIEHNHVKIPLETALDEESIKTFVEEKCADVVAEPQNATITRKDGAFVVTPSVIGKAVDIEATKKALNEALAKGLSEPVTANAVVTEKQPDIKTEDLSSIKDVLGTFSTSFSSSGAARSTNLRVGAGKINGHVLMPGETLSGYECMHPFTRGNGYATAKAYENGQVVDSVGGGVCQIATTLYNAVLQAELTVVQRQNHSMIIGYVKPSMDAAIAGTYKDIKFTNNYSTPIYVEGYTSGKTLTFTIYGKETRPANRTFKFVSETLGVSGPGAPKEVVDPSMAPGTKRKVQSSHTGIRSRLWKVIYVDGAEQSREILHTDRYNASKAIYKVGPAAPAVAEPVTQAVEEPVATQPAEPTNPQPVTGVQGGPGVPQTAAQAPTQAAAPAPTQAAANDPASAGPGQ